MPFTPNLRPFSGKINTVTLGAGAHAVTVGGQNTLTFYTFDAAMDHAPKVGVEISDDAASWTSSGIRAFYTDCVTMADYAKKAEGMEGADFLCLNFPSADPNGANRSVAECVADVMAVAEAVAMPIAVMGCKHPEKDGELFSAIGAALPGRNILFLSAKNENYPSVGAASLKNGQKVCAETADDINLAKQLNILLKGVNVPADSIVMNIGTAAVGYGYEYAASTMERVRLAALAQEDGDLQMPIVAPVSTETWGVKESCATEEDEPEWGSAEERAVSMEISTAAANLTCGADAVILRHPAAVATVKKFIQELV